MYYRDLKILFVNIPKTAGTSLFQVLDQNTTYKDQTFEMKMNKTDLETAKFFHRTAKDYICKEDITKKYYLSLDEFNSFFKFSVVRDPLDRAASMHRYLSSIGVIRKDMDINTFFLKWLPATFYNENSTYHFFVLPQKYFIFEEKKCLMDKVLYFENLENDVNDVLSMLKIKQKLPHLNSTKKSNYPDISKNKKIASMINFLYKTDYEFLYNK
jgi:hypothetical protein